MGIVLSHATARAVYQTAESIAIYATDPIPMDKIRASAPTTSDLEAARAWLKRKNVDSETIHVLTFSNNAQRHRKGCVCHLTRYVFDAESYLELEPNVYIVDIKLCALQAAADLDLSELVEYYFEICGSYALETSDETQYRERPALTTVDELRAFFSQASGYRGSNKALKALSYVRGGCRSPLETAFVMMLTMPKSMGGLGIHSVQTDYRVPVTKRYAALTRRTVFYLDAYLENSMTDIEYNGFYHDEPEQQAIDEERRNTLRNMGYVVITVSFSNSPPLGVSWRRFASARRYGLVAFRITSPSSRKLFANLSCDATLNTAGASSRRLEKRRSLNARLQVSAHRSTTRASMMSPSQMTCSTLQDLQRKSMHHGNATYPKKPMRIAREMTRLLM